MQTHIRSDRDCCPWTLDTKYYTANLQIDVVVLPHEPQLQDVASLPTAVEAVVAVVDAGSQDSWAAANKWLELADLDRCETRICVVNKADQCDVNSLPWMEDLQEWCLCNMFECIQVRLRIFPSGAAGCYWRVMRPLGGMRWE